MASKMRVLAVPVLLVAAACGGSSGGQPVPTVPGATTLDTATTRSVNASGGQTGGGQMYVGEYWDNSNLESRGAFLFDLTSLPAGSVVTQATLTVYVTEVEGGAAGLLPIVIDHDARPAVTYPQGGDFALAYDDEDFAQVNAPALVPMMPSAWTVDVTGVVGAGWAGGAASSVFRLRASSGPIVNGVIDAYLAGGTWAGDMQTWNPTLYIEYLAP